MLLERTREIATAFGRRAALHDLQQRLINRVVPFMVLRGMTAVAHEIPNPTLDGPELDTRFVTPDELATALAVPEIAADMSPAFVREAVDRGDACFGVFERDALISYGWYSNQATEVSDELALHFEPSWVYMYKGYTVRAHRGRRLHGIGMTRALHAYTQRGSRGLISYVRSTNFQSLRSTERMGYRTFGDIYVARVAGRPVAWATPGCTAYGFRVTSPTR